MVLWCCLIICFYLFYTDIEDCFDNECANGATCIDAVNSYTCKCVPGFVGKYCETSKLMKFAQNILRKFDNKISGNPELKS